MNQRQENCGTVMASSALQEQAAVYVGLSCALAALQRARVQSNVPGWGLGGRRCRSWNGKELRVQLLGLVIVQAAARTRTEAVVLQERLARSEREVEELRRRRAEDAKANEKVAGIFAAHEQRWLAERKALRRQLEALAGESRALKSALEGAMSELRRQLEELERAVRVKDEALEEEAKKREELEKKLTSAEQAGEELRERARKDAQDHSAEMRNHRAAFVELVSAQRQLEAELARAARHTEEATEELKEALERKAEAVALVEELSAEVARLQRDVEHKDRILSALLRKSKIDMEDKEMLVKEVKMSKAKKKQAELETERWRKLWESRHRRGSRPSRCAADHGGCSDKATTHDVVAAPAPAPAAKTLFVDHVEEESKKEREAPAPAPAKEVTTVECVDRYPSHVDDKPAVEDYDYHTMQEWLQMETEKHTAMIRHRHNAEIEAFSEQLRLKDEKLETFRWRTVSMDIEAARLRRRIDELEGSLSHYRQRNAEQEARVLDRENENRSLNEQLALLKEQVTFHAQWTSSAICPAAAGDNAREPCIPCSPVMTQRRKSTEAQSTAPREDMKLMEPVSQESRGCVYIYSNTVPFDTEATTSSDVSVPADTSVEAAVELVEEATCYDPTASSGRPEIEEREVYTDPGNARSQSSHSSQEASSDTALAALGVQRSSPWKTDIHALAVSYKIKRLKQQLLVLEKLAGGKDGSSTGRPQPRSYQTMVSFLHKHTKRYQSLEDKIDDLCRRMEESKRSGGREQQSEAEALGRFLEETFQLQRYMVATGQKLLEMQSKIAPGCAGAGTARGGGGVDIDMPRFLEVAGTLLRDIQRGLEVRIARIIADLEGTLTFHGILQAAF